MRNYFLRLDKKAEYLNLDGKDIEVNHLFITSAILESYFSIMRKETPLPYELNESLLKFNSLLGNGLITRILNEKNNIFFLFPLPIGLLPNINQTQETINTNLLKEINLLHYAVVNWIDKKNLPKIESIPDFDTIEGKTLMKLQSNLLNSPIKPWIIGNVAHHHESDSLLTLAWAEVWYALENNIRVRSCPYCGVTFPLPPNNPRKVTCLKPVCKQAYEVDRHGGIEAYREWERNRKKVPAKRPPGRPKIIKPVEQPVKKKVGRPKKEGANNAQ